MRVTLLGCGPSTGVPAIGGLWGACDPADPRNRRRRASLLVEGRGRTVLVDTSPDMREQLLDAAVTRVDAVILTHAHADHLHGIDDLRSVNRLMKATIPLFADASSLAEVADRFGYVFEPPAPGGFFHKPCLDPHTIDGPFTAAGIPVTPFAQDHGYSKTLGLRIGALGYSTDVTELDDAAFDALGGIEPADRRLPALRAACDAQTCRQDAALDRAAQAEAGGADAYGPAARLSRAGRATAAGDRARAGRARHRAARPMIRLAQPGDRVAVEAIVREAYSVYLPRMEKPPGPMLDDYAALIGAGSVSVVEEALEILAVIVLLPQADHLLLDNIAVRRDRQGTGLGRQLIAFAEVEARRLGFDEVRLYTHETMVENIALYTRLGFVETGRGHDAGYDRVFMTKRLARSSYNFP